MAKSKGEIPPGEDQGFMAEANGPLKFRETTTELQKPFPIQPLPQPEAEPAKPPVRRKLDPELKAMDAVCELLEDLTEQQRWRVINWALSRFMVENNGNLPKPTTQG